MINQMPGQDMVVLADEDVQVLLRAVRGQGGFQSLLRQVQQNMRGNVLLLTPALRQRIERYAGKYGAGGFQGRLGRLL